MIKKVLNVKIELYKHEVVSWKLNTVTPKNLERLPPLPPTHTLKNHIPFLLILYSSNII